MKNECITLELKGTTNNSSIYLVPFLDPPVSKLVHRIPKSKGRWDYGGLQWGNTYATSSNETYTESTCISIEKANAFGINIPVVIAKAQSYQDKYMT